MAVPTTITDLSTTANSNSPAGSEVPSSGNGPDEYIRALGSIVRVMRAKGSDVASATTTDLGAATTGDFVHVTGTTTITGLGTIAAGIKKIVTFDGALTLTHNGTSLILPGAANITTAAGDVGVFVSEGSGNWRCVSYTFSAGQGNVTGAASSIDSEIALFSGTGGKTIKRAATTGILKGASGVLSAASAGTDYVAPGAYTSSGLTMATAKILGRTTASTGAAEEISVGTGLTLSAGSLSASSTGTTLTSQATTSGSVQNVTSITSTSKRIDIALSNVSTSGSSLLCVKLGDSGGIESSGYTSMASIVNGAGGPSTSTTEFILATGTGASDVWNGTITLLMVDSATNTWSISSVLTNGTNMYASSGTKATSAALDRIQLTTAGGADTFDAGLMGTQY